MAEFAMWQRRTWANASAGPDIAPYSDRLINPLTTMGNLVCGSAADLVHLPRDAPEPISQLFLFLLARLFE